MASAIVVELPTPEALVRAARAASALGYERLQAFSPYEVPELAVVLRTPRSRIPRAVLVAALTGALSAFLVIWFCNAFDYPLDVGGRPLDSIPTDVPICFETAVLFGGTTSFVLVLLGSRLPRLYHPIFEVDGFERASIDRFFLEIGASAAGDDHRLRGELARCGATRIAPLGGAK